MYLLNYLISYFTFKKKIIIKPFFSNLNFVNSSLFIALPSKSRTISAISGRWTWNRVIKTNITSVRWNGGTRDTSHMKKEVWVGSGNLASSRGSYVSYSNWYLQQGSLTCVDIFTTRWALSLAVRFSAFHPEDTGFHFDSYTPIHSRPFNHLEHIPHVLSAL